MCVSKFVVFFFFFTPSQILGRNPFVTNNPKALEPQEHPACWMVIKRLHLKELNSVSASVSHQQAEFDENSQVLPRGAFNRERWSFYLLRLFWGLVEIAFNC